MGKLPYFLLFLLIVSIGLFLRFYKIEYSMAFNWDQGRDAWEVRDIILGNYTLKGPRTGVGDFYLGPAYYYLLAPFYLAANMDPKGANYFNIAANIFNFAAIYFVTKKIFSQKAAIFAAFIYSVNHYTIAQNMIPWNVSPYIGVCTLVFYCAYKVSLGSHKTLLPLAALIGFATQLHFTAVFLPFIVLPALFFAKNRQRTLIFALLAIPFFTVWLLPSIIFDYSRHHDNYYRLQGFFRDYYHGLHFRFMLYRLSDSFIQYASLWHFHTPNFIRYLPLSAFLVIAFFFEKDKKIKNLAILTAFWFIVPLVGFTLYAGQISDYYFLPSLFPVIITMIYLQKRLIQIKPKPVILLLSAFWVVYAITSTYPFWTKPTKGGLARQREETKNRIEAGEKLGYIEGDIKAYIYMTLKDKGMVK